MDAISLGPFLLSLSRVAGLAGLAVLLCGGTLLAHKLGPGLARWGWLSALAAALGARAGFVAAHWDSYAEAPLSALFFWQGGFSWIAGAAAAVIVSFWCFRESPGRLFWASIVLLIAAAPWLGFRALTRDHVHIPLPPLTLQTLDGRDVTLTSFAKPMVVNVWASWCAPCRREMPMLAESARRRQDVAFVFANQGEDAPTVRAYLQREELELPNVLLDSQGAVAQHFESPGLPTTLVFDAAGRLVLRHLGEISAAELAAALESVER